MLKKWSCVSALVACLAVQTANARNIFVTSADPGATTLGLFSTEPLLFNGSIPGPTGTTSVIAGPGGKYYAIGATTGDAVVVLQGTLPSLQIAKRIPLPGVPAAAILSADGRRLVVSIPAGVQIIDTTTDTALTATTGLNVGTNTPGIAVSTDSRRAFVASRSARRVLVLNLETGASAGEIAVEGEPAALSVGPNTLLYVSVRNAIYEYDPNSLELRGTFSMNGQPGRISFTPDGRLGVATNELLVTGKSAFILDLIRRTVSDVPIPNGVGFSKIVVGDNSAAYALARDTGRIYFINLLSSGVTPSFYNVVGAALENVRDIALSNEGPQARSLFVLTDGSLYKVDLAQSTVVGPLAAPGGTLLSFAATPITGTASTLLPINSSQTLQPGASSLPLRVLAVNNEGVPVSGLQVTFATEAAGVTLSSATATTDQLGYAQTVAAIPTTMASGVVTVNAAASGQNTSFAITVSGNNNPGPGPGPEPTEGGLQIVEGQGQVTSVGYPTNKMLTVRFVDSSGKPVQGVPVTWVVSSGTGSLGNVEIVEGANGQTYSSSTDEKGIAAASFTSFLVQPSVGYASTNVTVSAGSQTVSFVVTTIANLPNGNRAEAQFLQRKPIDRLIVARAGETLNEALEFGVGSLIGGGIPNIGIRLETPTGGPTATCRGGVPLSNNAGIVTCDLIAGPVVGETEMKAYVGESAIYSFTLRVTPGLASNLRILAGNNQTGATGQLLPAALSVQVTDAGGNNLTGIPVTWEVVTAGTASLSPTSSNTDENGRASTRVTLGQQAGLVQVRARSGGATVTFSLTAQAGGSQLTVTGGANQTAATGQQFATPISVTLLNAQNQPVVGATVQFNVTSGTATVPATAVTNSSGIATVNVTAGQTPGPVNVRATYGTVSQNISLTVGSAGPQFSAGSIVNAAGYQPGLAPGSIAVITASGIARDVRGSVTPQSIVGPLPTTLAGVEVLFNNVAAPIFAVSNINGQESVNVQVPFETTPGNASVTIRVAGGGQTTVSGIAIQPVKPGLFDFVDSNGRRYAVALRPDGSYVSSTNPARRGETVRVFATGMGQTSPSTGTNRIGQRDQNVLAPIIAGINGRGARLVSAKLLENAVGVYIVEIEIAADETVGPSQPVGFGIAGPDGVYVHAAAAIPIA